MANLLKNLNRHNKNIRNSLRVNSIWVPLSLLLVGVLTHIGIPYFFYFYIFSLGAFLSYYILKETKYNRISLILLSAPFWSSCLVIAIAGFFALLSIPIGLWIIWIPILFLMFLTIHDPIEFKKIKIEFKGADVILLVLGVASIGARVFSVTDYLVPILHDPLAHAVWAKQIYDTGLINYFYSPGLHILSALGMMADGINVSKYILIITNLFNALSFVPAYLFVKSYFKNKGFALLLSTLFISAIFPAKFFWAAGKNALVIAIPLIFLLLFVASLDLKKTKKILLLNLLVFALILVHYPVAFITLIGVFFILIYKKGIKGLVNIIVGCGLGIIWGGLKMKYELMHMQESVAAPSGGRALTIENVLSFSKGIYYQVKDFLNSPGGTTLFILGVIGLAIMTVIALKRKRYLYFMLFFYTNILFLFIISFVEELAFLRIVASTQQLTLFIFIYIGTAFFLGEVVLSYLLRADKRFIYLFYILLILLGIYGNYQIYLTYKVKQETFNMVVEDDLEAFKWMSTNLQEGNIILNNATVGDRKSVVFASDGGAWIPVFTNFDIAMPFTEFSSKKTHDNYEIYSKIFKEEYSCDDIDYLLQNNINYYYHGSKGVFGGEINPEGDNNFELVYSSGNAKVFKILPCERL